MPSRPHHENECQWFLVMRAGKSHLRYVVFSHTGIIGRLYRQNRLPDQILLTLCWHSVDALLTLCWRSVDALLTLIVRMWLGSWVCLFCTSRRLISPKWTATYQCQYFTINSSISECDDEYDTRNAELEIGTEQCSETRRNTPVDGYRSGVGPPGVRGSGFWTVVERNRRVFAVQTRTAGGLPGPVANTTQKRRTVLFWSIDHYILCPPCCWARCWMLEEMDHMEASCVFYVKVGRFDQFEQSKITVLTVTSFGIVLLTVHWDSIVSVWFR